MTIINIIKPYYDDGTLEPQSGFKCLLPLSASHWEDRKKLKNDAWQKGLVVYSISLLQPVSFPSCYSTRAKQYDFLLWSLIWRLFLYKFIFWGTLCYFCLTLLGSYIRFLFTWATGSPFSLITFYCSAYFWRIFCPSHLFIYFVFSVSWTFSQISIRSF